MFPPLLLLHPELAKTIVTYRYNTLPGARKEAEAEGFEGANFAWESAFTGKDVTPEWATHGEFQIHIVGWVALAQWQYYLATNDIDWLKNYGFPVIYDTAKFWTSRVKYNRKRGRYEIHSVTSPSEFPIGINNCILTNAIAVKNLKVAIEASELLGVEYPDKWQKVVNKMYIPFDEQKGIYYDGY